MKKSILASFLVLLFARSAQAVILDDEPTPAPKVEAKPKAKPAVDAEYDRLRKQLEKERMKAELKLFQEQKQAEQAAAVRKSQELEAQKANALVIVNALEMVTLPIGIEMGKFEVTQEQWQAVMGNNPSSQFSICGELCPVDNVSWNDVQTFILKLSKMTGKSYRLPTVDEWYLACQAGNRTQFCGSNNIDLVGWWNGNSGRMIHKVGLKQPNQWNLYDMTGNVFEWTSSCDITNCEKRIYVGGAFFHELASMSEASNKLSEFVTEGGGSMGFRLVRDL